MRVICLLLIFTFISCGQNKTVTTSGAQKKDTVDQPVNTDDETEVEAQTPGETGYDMNGQKRTCVDKSKTAYCSFIFTESDGFANDCRSRGDKAVMCECHDWICVR